MGKKTLTSKLPTLCYGCGTCAGVCPNDAIVMSEYEKKGIFLPVMNETRCNSCGLCLQVCPWEFLDKDELSAFVFHRRSKGILGNYLRCYLGCSTDKKLEREGSSGGLVSTLLTFALEEGIIDGALVTRMSDKEPLLPEPFIATTKSEVISATGSKYIPIPLNIVLKQIQSRKGKYAVVGLPCHIQGIRKAELINKKLNDKIVLHLGLFCTGTISRYGTDILLRSLNVDYENIAKICYREGSWPGGFEVLLKDGTTTPVLPYKRYFSIIRSYFPLSCFPCWDLLNDFSDISFGDMWTDHAPPAPKKGATLAISRTEKGEELLKAAASKASITLEQISPQQVFEAQDRSISFKSGNLAIRCALIRLVSKESPNFRNIVSPENSGFDYVSTIKTLLLFSRCLLMSNLATRSIINHFLVHLLKSGVRR
ncbi:4Fe-4S dicluster domain-containing protein [Candidatus Bathyarchaeota archaeon]|nr:MAG: 4Fe-4S dicluster domain-containing protein [Candidatus Bathyarchaeota archaeon]